jgi:hypothetical protein
VDLLGEVLHEHVELVKGGHGGLGA